MELGTIIVGLLAFAFFFYYIASKQYLVRDYYQDMVTTSWPGGVAVPMPPFPASSGSY
jgi:hypothetical protein